SRNRPGKYPRLAVGVGGRPGIRGRAGSGAKEFFSGLRDEHRLPRRSRAHRSSSEAHPLIQNAATRTDFPTSMNRIYHALLVVLAFEMGVLLLYLPWSIYWEQNFFLNHYPLLRSILLHPSFRGAVSGIGILDILLAIRWIGSRPCPPSLNREARCCSATWATAACLRPRPRAKFF